MNATQVYLGRSANTIGLNRKAALLGLAFAALMVVAVFAMASPARAANFVVTKTDDSGPGTLRGAVDKANGNGEEDTITFDLPSDQRTIKLDKQITFTELATTLDGDTAGVTISGEDKTRVFYVNSHARLDLKHLTVTNGRSDRGGGIYNDGGGLDVSNSTLSNNSATYQAGGIYNDGGTLGVSNSTFSQNSASDSGGGIYSGDGTMNYGTLTVSGSTFSDNSANSGGGIYNDGGLLDVSNSTFSQNSASDSGGGIYNGAKLGVSNSTFSQNSASDSGGGIDSDDTLDVSNSTFSGNSANYGGGVYNGRGNTTIASTTIVKNVARNQGAGVASTGSSTVVSCSIIAANTEVDLYSGSANTFVSGGHNVIGDGKATSAFDKETDQTNVSDPGLGPLQDNGGPTQTHALLEGSPAIDKGDTAHTTDLGGIARLNIDQRGATRPVDGDGDGNAQDDAGSFELHETNPVVTSNANSGAGTLRDAVNIANGNGVPDTITFDLPSDQRTIKLASQITFEDKSQSTTIDGGKAGVTVSGNEQSRVFLVGSGVQVELKGLTVAHGSTANVVNSYDGGGIKNYGTLTVSNSTFSQNSASGTSGTLSNGGGIASYGTLDVSNSTFSDNSASLGGGIYSFNNPYDPDSTTIENSTISGNSAGAGGGVFNGRGQTTITSTTIVKNVARNQGAGVANFGQDELISTKVGSSIIAGNDSTDVDFTTTDGFAEAFVSQGYNVIGDGNSTSAFDQAGDQVIKDKSPGLDAALANNDGPTSTYALLAGSPAIDAIPQGTNGCGTTLTQDQRGISRPQGSGCDIGSFELISDSAPPALSINDASVAEGNSGTTNATFTVALSAASGKNVTVNYTTADGSAKAGSDYTATSGTLTIPSGATTSTVSVPVIGDTTYEPDESFSVNLSDPTGATIGDGQGVGTIRNDDSQPTLSINDTSVNEGNSGTTSATFTVSLSAASGRAVMFDYATQDVTATAGSDYTATSGTLTIPSGSITSTVSVPVIGDTIYEPDETFHVDLSSPTGATIGNGQGVGTIRNDDFAPEATPDSYSTNEDNTLTVSAPGVLTNDTDKDSGDKITAVQVSGPSQAESFSLNSDGSFTYKPVADYNGPDSFTYKARDASNNESAPVRVSLIVNAVNDAPVANDDTATTSEDTSTDIAVLSNDTDVEGESLSVSSFSKPANGTLTANANGTLRYTPKANFNGDDSFTYTAKDGSIDSNQATVYINVKAVNDAPSFTSGGNVSVAEDSGAYGAPWATAISKGAYNEDAQKLTFTVVGNDNPALFSAGPRITPEGKLEFTPAKDANGSSNITVVLKDDGGTANGGTDTSGTRTFTITVTPVNDAPTVALSSGGSCSTSTASVSGTMNLSLVDVDSTVGGLTLSASSSNKTLVPPSNVKFGGSGANRTVTITPVPQKTAQSAEITITASDGTAKSTTTIKVIVGTDKKETINGTTFSDMIFGLNGDDTINAGEGNDLACGGNAGGVISGGAGDDTLDGGNGNDTLRGDDGNDALRGGQGTDSLYGGNNDDTLTGGSGTDLFDGGAGTDTATDYNASEGDTRTNIP